VFENGPLVLFLSNDILVPVIHVASVTLRLRVGTCLHVLLKFCGFLTIRVLTCFIYFVKIRIFFL